MNAATTTCPPPSQKVEAPPATAESMALLVRLLEERGVELRVSPSGELLLRDRGKRLSAGDRDLVHHYRHDLADCLTAPTIDEEADGEPPDDWLEEKIIAAETPAKPSASKQTTGPTCDRCGGGEFVEVEIHGGRSVRRDCARCRRTWGFPVWYGEGGR